MQMNPPIIELLGGTPRSELIMFFLCHPFDPYTIQELAEFNGMSRQTVSKHVKILLRFRLIKKKDGRYKTFVRGGMFGALLDLNDEICETIIAEELKKLDESE